MNSKGWKPVRKPSCDNDDFRISFLAQPAGSDDQCVEKLRRSGQPDRPADQGPDRRTAREPCQEGRQAQGLKRQDVAGTSPRCALRSRNEAGDQRPVAMQSGQIDERGRIIYTMNTHLDSFGLVHSDEARTAEFVRTLLHQLVDSAIRAPVKSSYPCLLYTSPS